MNSEFQNLIAYLQTYFEEDIVAALLRQRKKECQFHENNARKDFEKEKEWYIENPNFKLSRRNFFRKIIISIINKRKINKTNKLNKIK